MPKSKEFDFDEYFARAKYSEVEGLSPMLRGREPSCFSPDRSEYNASSVDLVVATNDLADLKNALVAVVDKFRRTGPTDYRARFASFTDIEVICELLSELGETHDPRSYVAVESR